MNIENNLNLKINYLNFINYTFISNKLNFIQNINLQNLGEKDLENIKITLKSTFKLFEDFSINKDRILPNEIVQFTEFNLKFNLELLKNLAEKDLDKITIEVLSNNEVLKQEDFTIDILPIDYFGGLHSYPQLLASYILPNHDLIYSLKTEAIKILESNNHLTSFEGYQSHNKERVLQIVSAIYKAIQNHQIIYSAMPASFEKSGQRIRLIDKVINTKFGNCIDISLLFAAVLEAINLNPLIIITSGHAFVGVWLEDMRFDGMINYDVTALTKRVAKGIKQIALIEATSLCKGNNIPFSQAMDTAERQLLATDNFLLSIDIKKARSYGITPLSIQSEIKQTINNSNSTASNTDNLLDEDFDIGTSYDDLELTDLSNLTKQKIWERKLLDLSLRNNLLNLRFTKSMLQIIDLKSHLLEDNLAEGKSYIIQPDNNQPIIRRYNIYNPPLHSSDTLFTLADEEFKYGRLLTYYHNDDLNSILTNLYRSSRLAEEENGKSTLYLGIGLLKWFEPRNKLQPRYAPILLIPVELSRKSANSKYTLRSREEETMINITLLEYLKQEYKLNLNSLENLPTDDFGVDVPKVFAILRNAIMTLGGWDVLEQTVLGIFSFNKLILWQDISKYAAEIEKSSIVKSLIDGKLSENLQSVDGNELELENLPTSSLFLPISADNSQLNAVKSANENKTFILHGPPGTGKSQTITNIIADALANNKKVLFVAAKKAALDVVHTRLEHIGLGPFCLELHSNKSKKSDVLQQFERTLDVPKYQSNESFIEEANRLDSKRKELNQYVIKLHEKNEIGWSIYDTISYLEYYKIQFSNELRVAINFSDLNTNKWNEWQNWNTAFHSIIAKIEVPNQHALKAVKSQPNQFDLKNNITNAIQYFLISKKEKETSFEKYAMDNAESAQYLPILKFIQANPINEKLIDYVIDETQKSYLSEWIHLNQSLVRLRDKIISSFNAKILDYNYQEIQMIWNQAKYTWFLPKWLKQRKVKGILQGFSSHKITHPESIDELFANLDELNVLQKNEKEEKFRTFNQLFEKYKTTNSFNHEGLLKEINIVEELIQLINTLSNNPPSTWLKSVIANTDFNNELDSIIKQVELYQSYETILLQFLNQIPADVELAKISTHINLLDEWLTYKSYEDKAKQIGTDWFIEKIEEGVIDTKDAQHEFEKVLRLNHFVQSLYSTDELNHFDADIYESLIKQYKEIHYQFTELSKQQLVAQLSAKIPNLSIEAAQSSEIGMLQKAIRSKGRGITIRRLFDQIPTLIPRLKPCMLMSPISVAQYFDVNQEHFDLVIFDEASQLPTSEAISALARGKQAIIVGDPKQMPPTSFFASSKIDEENLEMEDLESILEDTLALSIPSNHLLRHYRSKHESLISFSNKNFYDSKLLTFPSPDDLNQKVTFQQINGFYDKGKTRTNKNEALAIVEYIQSYLQSGNKKSLGVVTFSQVQQDLIEDLLQELFQKHPQLEELAMQNEEPIFIKNLENVQGDERDIILFSICYGPNEEGKISMNFGPLNREGGWRRLNVAVTRARYEMKVFSTLKGDQIDLNRTKSEGVKGLKEFLNFAEKGSYILHHTTTTSNRISLVDAIENELKENGLQVNKYIGTSNYRVDLGIVNPDNDKEYILGILVDGDNYNHINTTNDRELLAPNVLKGLGWNIYRIWTLDWIKNKDQCIQEIHQLVDDIKKNKVQKPILEIPEMQLKELPKVNELTVKKIESSFKIPYQSADITSIAFANAESIYFPENRRVILNQMKSIVEIEAPISKSLLFRRILKLWNTARAGAKLSMYLSDIVASIPNISKSIGTQDFYWNSSSLPKDLKTYRDNAIEKRSIEDIAPEEISIAILEIMEANISLNKEDLVRLTARTFDFLKVGSQIDSILNQVIQTMVNNNQLIQDGNRLRIIS
ncbi:DUF3320 domain-containing protein [Sphingobacterium composti Ten et al. 2007 non Yoo et al. 2007]|uniref:DUF3320 domain-containing protein n=1 Tax=Sphingobacterium composti TaxID=363260 RepID=UPI001358CFD3|nr:DUF3320 domain-containing protein [Sphingobacterium composti Ten et al. 2007 non Yoo et al. 2007]